MAKIAFATCVQLGLSCIEAVYEIGGNFDLFITLNDEKATDKSGRIYLDEIAQSHNVPLVKINNINVKEVTDSLKKYEIDWLFIIGWSQIAKKDVLNAPRFGCIGMHPTLLPQGRGRAAIPWAILKGLTKTGVTLFKLDEGVDTGDIIGQEEIQIENNTNATVLYKAVDDMHVTLMKKYWHNIVSDNISLTKQDESKATEWEGRKPSDGEIFSSMTVKEADRLVRAVTHPYPGAFIIENGKKYIIWEAEFSEKDGRFRLADGYLSPINYEVSNVE